MFCEMQLDFSGSDTFIQHHLILIERMLYVEKFQNSRQNDWLCESCVQECVQLKSQQKCILR